MADTDFKVSLLGDKQLEAMLRGWKPAAQRRIVRPGIAMVSRRIAKRAKRNAPRKSGVLRSSIGSVVRTYKSGVVVGVVGPRHGFERAVQRSSGAVITKKNVAEYHNTDNKIVKQDPVKYAHLVESGTQPHSLGKGSKIVQSTFVGSVVMVSKSGKRYRKKRYMTAPGKQYGKQHPGAKPSGFMLRAFFSEMTQARAIMRRSMGEQVRKEAMRLVRRKGLAA